MNRMEGQFNNDNDFDGEVDIQELNIELKANEDLFMVTIEFTEGSEIMMVRSREIQTLQRILQYNRFSYSVDIVATGG